MAKAKFDIKTEATRTLHAGVGAADLAVEAVKEYVAEAQKKLAEVQKSVASYDFEPKALREQATTVITARVEELSTEAKARRTVIEKRVAELQGEAQKLPTRVQSLVTENVGTATGTYEDLVKRGETVVAKLRKQPAKPAAKTTASTTTAPKTTKSSATKSTTKKTASTAKKTAS
jgi:predicted  nucleic acid-binding Zn-ribbon protein